MTMTSGNASNQGKTSRRRPRGVAGAVALLRVGAVLTAAVAIVGVPVVARAADQQRQPATAGIPAAAASAAPTTRPAGEQVIALDSLGPDHKIQLLVGRSLILKSPARIRNVSFSQPEIAADNEL